MNITIKLSKNKFSPSACTYLLGPNIPLRLHLGCQNKFHVHTKNNNNTIDFEQKQQPQQHDGQGAGATTNYAVCSSLLQWFALGKTDVPCDH